ncbi:hypothetical protein ASG86_12560 [Arthrobacter sp. Soil764]|nr:hypothetical protein ASG86_12560 [Arthrobacter sp. Soil764]
MWNGALAHLCGYMYINQGFGYNSQGQYNLYSGALAFKATDACGNVVVDYQDYGMLYWYPSAGTWSWDLRRLLPYDLSNACDGTWNIHFSVTQTFPDGQTLSDSVDGPATVNSDAGSVALAPEQCYGGAPVHATQGDPVDSFSGAFNNHLGADLSLSARGGALETSRSYASNVARASAFGPGWSYNYDASLTADGTGKVSYHDPSGSIQVFTPNGTGGFVPPPGVHKTLAPVSGGGYTLTSWDRSAQTFNSAGQLTATKDRNGQGATFSYSGSQLATVSGSGRTLTFTWDPTGTRITKVPGNDGRAVQYGYDSSLRLTTFTDARGKVTTYGYDGGGRLNSIRDPNGNYPVRLTYDPVTGRVSQQQDPNGGTTFFAWDNATQTASTTDPRGLVSKDVYINGYLIQQVDAAGNSTRYSWNNDGQLLRVSNPTGQTTSFRYDSNGNVVEKISPDKNYTAYSGNPSERYYYDNSNNLLAMTDFRGTTTQYSYDAAGNLATVTRPDVITGSGTVAAVQNTYNPDGTLKTSTDANNRVTTYGYNAAGDLTSVTTAAGRTTTYGYDAAGRLVSTVSPRGNVSGANPDAYRTTNTLNENGQVIASRDPLGNTTSSAVDDAGRLTAMTDARGSTTTATYLPDGHISTVQGPDTRFGPERFTYDADGNVATKTSPAGVVTTFTYTVTNQRATASSTGTGQYTYAYDAAGRLTSQTAPSGRSVTFSRNSVGAVTKISFSDGTAPLSYTFDNNGNRTGLTDGLGSTAYTYNTLNQLTKATRGTDTWTYAFDNTGSLVSRATPGAAAQQLSYDADGRLTKVMAGTSTLVSYAYNDPTADTVATLPGGVTQTTSIDAAGRPAKVTGAKGSTILAQSTYQLDPNGSPTTITGPTGTTDTYTYDVSNRLTSACYGTTTCTGATNYIKWGYDADGNQLTETRPAGTTTYSYNTTGRLTGKTGASGSAAYTYDADGNVTSDGTNNYTWNAAGQLLTAGGAKPTKYTYDGDNRRTSITNGNSVINPVWDPASGQLLAERDGNGKTLRGYTYGTGLVGMTAGTASYSYLTDAQGSVRAVVDAAGAPQWNYAYEPYGVTRSAVAVSGRQAPTNPRQYLGAYVDGAAYNLNARQYLPGTGRFLSTDPVASPGLGYAYGSANPMVYMDPFGMDDFEWIDIVHDVSTGVAAAAGAILIGCTLAVICAETDVVTAPLAAFAGAVSWATDDNTGKCFSGKGGCAETVIFGALTAGGFGGLSTVARLGKAAESTAASGMAGVRAAGRAGEAAAGIVKNTKRIPSATGTAEFRIPDELGNGILGEVKNVKSLTYTSQLQDFVAYSQANNLQFNLYVRQSTTFSGPLQGQINAGTITRVPSLGP